MWLCKIEVVDGTRLFSFVAVAVECGLLGHYQWADGYIRDLVEFVDWEWDDNTLICVFGDKFGYGLFALCGQTRYVVSSFQGRGKIS